MARLGNAMQALVQSMGKSETAIIFITDTSSEFDINKALGLYNAILKNHTKLTFILAGEKAKAENLAEFNATIFDWKNMDLEKPNNWNAFKAFGC
uniref:VWFA domain-containing protein n=1 Tax=Panagrolaimus superbus TaxID=310955 RepID=A0A914XWB4_9BILA